LNVAVVAKSYFHVLHFLHSSNSTDGETRGNGGTTRTLSIPKELDRDEREKCQRM